MIQSRLPVAVIGAGPVGLAAAAQLLSRGEVPLVLEAGGSVGHNVRSWGHVRMFSPWRYNVDRQAAALLDAAGWRHPPHEDIPTGAELVRDYLEPLAALPAMARHIHLNARVVAVTRKNCDKVRSHGRELLPFVLRVRDAQGGIVGVEARAVIDASGTWTTPNPAGADGLLAIGEEDARGRISAGIPDVLGSDRMRYAGKTVAVVGGGHSALNVLIDLAKLRAEAPDTRVVWLMRKDRVEAAYGGEEADGLPARGALGSRARLLVESGAVRVMTPFRIGEIGRRPDGGLVLSGDFAGRVARVEADELIVATGFRPDLSLLREVRLSLDPWLECAAGIGGMIDPNVHSCGTVRPHGAAELAHAEPNFYIAGIKSYGRAPTFLLATGHEQVRSIAAALAGDLDAAARVELELPETGVCTTRPAAHAADSVGCCGGPPKVDAAACCAADEDARLATDQGCGCGSAPAASRAATSLA